MMPECDGIIARWIECNPGWVHEIHFSDHPPKLVLRLARTAQDESRGIRKTAIFDKDPFGIPESLAICAFLHEDDRSQAWDAARELCHAYGFKYRRWIKDGVVKYELWKEDQ